MAIYSKKGRRYFGTQRRDARFMTEDMIKEANDAARDAALEIINGLAKAGPYWDGHFRNEWVAIPLGSGASGGGGGSYPYQLNNIPELAVNKNEAGRVAKYEIVNQSKYAPYAMDLQPGKFNRPNFPRPGKGRNPKGNAKPGTRDHEVPTLRGDITLGEGGSQITAPLNWYVKFIQDGRANNSLKTGANRGLKFRN
tara:strand:+ start:277 stop:864 length:588 start_codon:yes stop_codon:yes gene_type:complete